MVTIDEDEQMQQIEQEVAERESEALCEILPEDILSRILTRLPIECIFRCKLVCKSWQNLIDSPEWRRFHADNNSSPVWTLKAPRPHNFTWISFASRSRAKNLRLTTFFHPERHEWVKSPWHPPPPLPECSNWILADVDGGLFCYKSKDVDGHLLLCVCNPLMKCHSVLPPHWPPTLASMVLVLNLVANRRTGHFRLVVAGAYTLQTVVFDSETAQWRVHKSSPKNPRKICRKTTCDLPAGIVWRDVIYYQHNHGDEEGLEAFDIASGVWSSLKAPLPSRFGYNVPHILYIHGDRICLVGSTADKLTLWTLHADDAGAGAPACPFTGASWWEKRDVRMPREHSNTLSRAWNYYSTLCHGDFLCFVTKDRHHRSRDWFYYSLASGAWSPRLESGGSPNNLYDWFAWEPSFSITEASSTANVATVSHASPSTAAPLRER
ncbi:hypothetical protein MPTK1_5g10110 [Marchantia polymorpha subsp. ruderalis]|nr:hypothetical protein MARPO_0048s0061 [Marchantia polymorpha]BBN11222.1 hypothetical protein Mp_5g10110 [Marchantia polymorpha subsp. ruderalis]|eukprot:PTQ38948.1 hypothetical protein MARPO_0048s0061 [Marchantia polymorpha]